jgi:hypothetical protein
MKECTYATTFTRSPMSSYCDGRKESIVMPAATTCSTAFIHNCVGSHSCDFV